MRLLDQKFRYVPSNATNVAATWRRFGFRPTTEAERRARQAREQGEAPEPQAAVRTPRRVERKVARLKLAVAE